MPTKARVAPATIPAGCRLVRDTATYTAPVRRIASSVDAVRIMEPIIGAELVEHFYLLALDTRSHVVAICHITTGLLDASLVHPREVFRAAILNGAAAIILAHNHPSGDPTPSMDDRAVTRQLVAAGQLLDIPVYDHIVIGSAGRYVSFVDEGYLA